MKKTFLFLSVTLLTIISSCSVNKAKIDNDLKKYFDSSHVDGCFSLLDNASGEITIYNMKLDTQRALPASTFKIVNSLIGLETGKITDEKMVIKWDGIKRWNDDWNKDLTMEEAFKVSAVPYYQEVARRIGRDTMQRWIDSLHYGNMNISGPIDSFWLNNTLKISPDEQLGLVYQLYFDKLPFTKRSQQIVRDVMLQENDTLYKLSYKTGWGFDEKNNAIGWVVGWIEENRHVYFFVTQVKSPDRNIDMPTVRMKIFKGILSELGFFKGEK
ncbi:class D beta-lactamase [Ginsengibacter hankyongi]|uniref:Beta-lactamase n=1 Tax=Ginsengibacter hankyongi TaxID=2607284 RepID=A0A5J5IJF8_9BACT|nr:class D beta-lactamase [Ginsengibacter hankyongi]KAA9039422.1 class D beta-lactamase [Ginsengibacter hankyongi]